MRILTFTTIPEIINEEGKKVKISMKEFLKLCERFGVYSFNWYFVSPNTIKYFDGNEWRIEKIKIKLLQ